METNQKQQMMNSMLEEARQQMPAPAPVEQQPPQPEDPSLELQLRAKELITLTGKECGVGVEEIHTFHDPEEGKLRGTNIIHIFSAEGMKVAHMGDLGCELSAEQLEKLQGLDAMLVPVGGFYTIDAKQAKALVDAVKPRVVIPMHYRGENFGYEVIGPVEDYLALCDNVVKYEGNSLELTKDTPAQTAVLTYVG